MPWALGHAAFGRDVLHFAGASVAARDRAAEQDFGMQRIGRGVAGFAAGAQSHPIALCDLAAITSYGCANRATVLLRARHPVRKPVVRRDVIELRGGLVVPRTPCRAAVKADDRPLIAPDNHPVPLTAIHPNLLIISSAARPLPPRPA